MGNDCVFCKIVAGEIPARFEYQDEEVVGFWDANPTAPVHLLVVPRKHVRDLEGVDEAVVGKLQKTIGNLAVKMGIQDGYKVFLNAGRYQEVPHLHYHLKGGEK